MEDRQDAANWQSVKRRSMFTIAQRDMQAVLVAGLVALVAVVSFVQPTSAGAATRHQSIKSKLLTIANMPAGWRVDNSSGNGGIGGTKCLSGLDKANEFPAQAGMSFVAGAGVPFFGETLGSGKKLSRAFSKITTQLGKCKTLKLKENGTTYPGTIGMLSFPTIGKKSSAFLITFAIKGVTAGIDLIVFATGPYVGALVYGDVGTPELSQVEAFANLALAKLKGLPLPPLPTTTTTVPVSVA